MTNTLAFLFAILVGGAPQMADENAVAMNVSEEADAVVVELVAETDRPQIVEYEIEVTGSSRSVHKGKTTIGSNQSSPLSRFRVSHAGTWCAQANIREEDGRAYQLEAGECSPGDETD